MTQLIRAAAAFLILSAISGCAYLKPYVEVNPPLPTLPPTEASKSLPKVSVALQLVDAWRNDARAKHDEVSLTNRSLNVATFGLAAAAVVAPVYNAYKDLITGLSIGAGGAYAGTALFFPADQIGLYDTAAGALTCIHSRAQGILASVSPDWTLASLDNRYSSFISDYTTACATTDEYARLTNAYASARDSLRRAFDADYAAGEKLSSAGRSVVDALNSEIDKRAPSSAAILAAAKSLVALNVPAAAVPATKKAAGLAAFPFVPPACTNEQKARLTTEAEAYIAKQRAIDDALQATNDLSTACPLNIQKVEDLKVSQDKITLSPSSGYNVVIEGGRQPYTCAFEEGNDPSANGITATMIPPTTCKVAATSDLKKAATYQLTIRDSSTAGRYSKVEVTAKP
jgi:hypothetical protein